MFSHEALYIALSRCTDPLGESIFITQTDGIQDGILKHPFTTNIVYDEVIRTGFCS